MWDQDDRQALGQESQAALGARLAVDLGQILSEKVRGKHRVLCQWCQWWP